MTRTEEINNAIHHSNDYNLAKTIIRNITQMNETGSDATDIIQQAIVEMRNASVDSGAKGGK